MKKSKSLYRGHRFPAGVISCAVRWYFRFQLSLRDIEELLFERGVAVTYETIRCWCDKFGKGFAVSVSRTRVDLVVLLRQVIGVVGGGGCYGITADDLMSELIASVLPVLPIGNGLLRQLVARQWHELR